MKEKPVPDNRFSDVPFYAGKQGLRQRKSGSMLRDMYWCYLHSVRLHQYALAAPSGRDYGCSQARTRLSLTLIYKIPYMPRKKLPSGELRTATITTKITAAERIHIQETARKCGLTPSEYMRQRAIGYEPPSTLTAEESGLLHNLDNCRVDIVNYANALAGMKREQRMAMFNRVPFMLEWYKQIIPVTNAVNDFISSVVNGGRIQKRTITNLRKLNK